MQSDESTEIPFETALKDLETLVAGLEQGDSPLNELVDSYEKGKKLLDICRSRLQDAELRISVLNKDGSESALNADTDSE